MRVRRRLDGTVRTTIQVPFQLTREQIALALMVNPRYRPAVRLRAAAGLELIRESLRNDSANVLNLHLDPVEDLDAVTDPAYRAALADVDRWAICAQVHSAYSGSAFRTP